MSSTLPVCGAHSLKRTPSSVISVPNGIECFRIIVSLSVSVSDLFEMAACRKRLARPERVPGSFRPMADDRLLAAAVLGMADGVCQAPRKCGFRFGIFFPTRRRWTKRADAYWPRTLMPPASSMRSPAVYSKLTISVRYSRRWRVIRKFSRTNSRALRPISSILRRSWSR